MKTSDLAKSEKSPALVHGVEVDEVLYSAPDGLETIGILWDGDKPDSISDDVIDTIIGLQLSGVTVILEIRPTDEVASDYILMSAGNAGFAVSLVPPEDEAGLEAWCAQCARFSEALLTIPNFAGELIPVTGFVGYLIGEYFAGQTAASPDDDYVVQRFVDPCPTEWSDAAKDAMRRRMSEVAGGEEELKAFFSAVLVGMVDRVEEMLTHVLDETT